MALLSLKTMKAIHSALFFELCGPQTVTTVPYSSENKRSNEIVMVHGNKAYKGQTSQEKHGFDVLVQICRNSDKTLKTESKTKFYQIFIEFLWAGRGHGCSVAGL